MTDSHRIRYEGDVCLQGVRIRTDRYKWSDMRPL